ncbi:hypothetical protein SAMN06265338_103216 [Rhodoblastus acidophilus]|uniref:Uncharacterized protein n=2 Tax=Rhodoblastus acidophilus TaxID=1074 RepID=A0A212RB04_RHOAC|nr:hypothetical protein [Rhodoblastus acidophilus]PPQ39370.1 hypothetical protein CKO16_06345 [Rhodoblastus acidophilus]SNB69426.1 hypothetical protein SAMN06265338_103216 [Rhodoblastus acidophilus]
MLKFRFSDLILREAEGGSGAGGGAAAASGAAPGADGAAQNTGAGGDGAPAGQASGQGDLSAFRPEGLPDHLYGASDRETVEKLYGAYKGARDAIATFGEVPKDAAGYVFEPSETVKPFAESLSKDPFFEKVKGLALQHKIPAKQFNGFIDGIMSEMIAGELVTEPFNAEKERLALAPDIADPKERAAAADKIARENIALVDVWKSQGMPENVATWLHSQLDRASANQLVSFFADRLGEERPALGGTPVGNVTETQLDARMADPRNQVGGPQYDAEFAKQTAAMFKAFYV